MAARFCDKSPGCRVLSAISVALSLRTLGCTYGEPVERAIIQNVAVKPGSSVLAAMLRYERFRPPTGLSAFPDGGVPRVLELRADVCILDMASGTVLRRAEIAAPAANRVSFGPWIAGWERDTLFLSMTGCPGQPGDECYGSLVKTTRYRLGSDGSVVEISEFPKLTLTQADRNESGRFLGASKDSKGISIATEQLGPYRPAFRIDGARLVASSGATR